MDELAPIGIAIAVIVGIIYVLVSGLRYLFLFAGAALGHPLFLTLAVTCAALIWQLQRISDTSMPDATLFDRTMSTRRWMIMGTAGVLILVSAYGVLVL